MLTVYASSLQKRLSYNDNNDETQKAANIDQHSTMTHSRLTYDNQPNTAFIAVQELAQHIIPQDSAT